MTGALHSDRVQHVNFPGFLNAILPQIGLEKRGLFQHRAHRPACVCYMIGMLLDIEDNFYWNWGRHNAAKKRNFCNLYATSSGVFFHGSDIPANTIDRDTIFVIKARITHIIAERSEGNTCTHPVHPPERSLYMRTSIATGAKHFGIRSTFAALALLTGMLALP